MLFHQRFLSINHPWRGHQLVATLVHPLLESLSWPEAGADTLLRILFLILSSSYSAGNRDCDTILGSFQIFLKGFGILTLRSLFWKPAGGRQIEKRIWPVTSVEYRRIR